MVQMEYTDVLVCGAGPVGLTTALGLAQQGVSSIIIEKRDREAQRRLGRACTLYPRTLELLEGLDVTDDMLQVGFYGRSYAVYRAGKHVMRKAWQNMFPIMDNSFHNYILNIRQSRSEDIFASAYEATSGQSVRFGWEIVELSIDQSLGDGYNVTAVINHASLGKRSIRCKYLLGADGGNSTVRRLAEIPLEGNETTHRWVRIDGKINTDLPEQNLVFAVIETKTHGAILWAKLDGDAARIGYALTPTLQAKYPDGMTEEQVLEEAKECMKPFKCEIERLDWSTQYSVKQKVAESFQKSEYLLIAGDAAHTHSSAFAQGMNTGVHDATNLAWKLAGTIKGWYTPEVLATYSAERHAGAEKVVSVDRVAAAAVNGDIPPGFQQAGMSNEDAFRSIMETNLSLTTGLGVSYGPSLIVASEPTISTLVPGTRTPDAMLKGPGPTLPLRVHDIINHRTGKGTWTMLTFAGYHHITKPHVIALREAITNPESLFIKKSSRLRLATIIIGNVGSAWEAFDGPALGPLFFDVDSNAHSRYGIYPDHGGIVLIRPDGIVSFAVGLDEVEKMEEFCKQIFV